MAQYINADSKQYFAFNIWDMESAKGVLDAASTMQRPVILQTSVKAFELIDKEELRFYVTNYSQKYNIEIYLHLDHCKKIDIIETAIDYGWDSVMIDASGYNLSENIAITNKVKGLGHEKGVLVEAEVGSIPGVEDDITECNMGIADIEEVFKFISGTQGLDMLAVAIGTVHGQYEGVPNLNYDMLGQIKEFSDIPLVIHGGTGLTGKTYKKLLSFRNVKKINISTDVKLAYREGIILSTEKGYLEKAAFDPLMVTDCIHDCIKKMTMNKLELIEKEE